LRIAVLGACVEVEMGKVMYRGSKIGYRAEDEIKLHILLQQRNENEDEFIKSNLRKTCTVFYSGACHER
jgi:hypothetical protein